jgi:hypothetical protein
MVTINSIWYGMGWAGIGLEKRIGERREEKTRGGQRKERIG